LIPIFVSEGIEKTDFSEDLPSNSENGPVEDVFPIENGDIPLYQRVRTW